MLFISFINSVVISSKKSRSCPHCVTKSISKDPARAPRLRATQEWDAKPLNFTAFYTLAGSGGSISISGKEIPEGNMKIL